MALKAINTLKVEHSKEVRKRSLNYITKPYMLKPQFLYTNFFLKFSLLVMVITRGSRFFQVGNCDGRCVHLLRCN